MDNRLLETYRQQFFNVEQRKFKEKTAHYLQEHAETIIPQIKREVETFFSELIRIQKKIPVEVGWITLSLMVSSVYLKEPVFHLTAYDEGNTLGKKLHRRVISADWLFSHWGELEQSLLSTGQGLPAAAVVYKEQIRILMFETLDYLRNLFVAYLKYPLKEYDQIAGYQDLLRAEQFGLSAGYHLDWQKLLFMQKPEVDIFFNPANASLQYQIYKKKVYRNKTFSQLDLLGSRFQNCKFEQCRFEQCDFSDCIFEDCFFEQIQITDSRMFGITFRTCTIKEMDFSGVQWYCREAKPGDLFKHPEFIDCQTDDPLPEMEVR